MCRIFSNNNKMDIDDVVGKRLARKGIGIAHASADVSGMVPPCVKEALTGKLG